MFITARSHGYETGYIFSPSSANTESELTDKGNYSTQQKSVLRVIWNLGASGSFQRPSLKDKERIFIEYSTTS